MQPQNWLAPQTLGIPIAQWVKNLPAMQETVVLSVGQEDPLEKEMATLTVFLCQLQIGTMPFCFLGCDFINLVDSQRT